MKTKISFDKYPIDVFLCILYSIILIPLTLLDVRGILRIVIGLPFILFIPGYLIIFSLFPTKKADDGITIVERITLSFGISMAIIALIGTVINFTYLRTQSIYIPISIFIFIIFTGTISIYRWFKTSIYERFIITINLSKLILGYKFKAKSKFEKILIITLIISIIITASLFIFVISYNKNEEKFTSFYILGEDKSITTYPKNLSIGENATIILGVTNHEYEKIDYTIEIWLINQSKNNKSVKNVWFMDKIRIKLDHYEMMEEKISWKPQWEYKYNFNISKKGDNYKLIFILYKYSNDEKYYHNKDYKDIIQQKLNDAYETLYLWINVK